MIMEIGRLVYDVEVKEVGEEKKKVINNRIAINVGKNKTTYIDIIAWNGVADLIGRTYKKGYEICVVGNLINTKKKTTKDGVEFEYDTVALRIDHIVFTNGNPKEQ